MVTFVSKLRFPEERGAAAADIAVCRSFVEIGQEVELLIPNRKPKIITNVWDFYQIKKNLFSIKKLFCLEITAPKLYFFVMSWGFSLAAWWYLYTNKREYIHLFNECRELGIILRFFSFIYKPWLVYEVHDLPTNNYELFLDKLLKPDLVLTTTNRFGEYYSKYNVLIYPNGVFLEDFDYKTLRNVLKKQLGLPLDKIIVGYAGRFLTDGQEKGIPELITACQKLKNVFLVCVGGPLTNKYSGSGLFLDRVPVKTLYKYMRAFDVCVMPFPWTKHYAYRMSPLKMFEYMASKNPLVATDLPIVHEVLKNNVNCVMAKPGDPIDLAVKIKLIIKNKKLGKIISQNAFNEVKSKYLWIKRAQHEIDCYFTSQKREAYN